MAKKTRRARLSATQRFIPGTATPAPALEPVSAPAAAHPAPRTENDAEAYAYITADLRRIAILAGSILTVLIALRVLIFR